MKRFVVASLTATALLLGTSSPGWSAPPPPPPAATGIGAGGWIVGAGVVSALSTIICASWIGKNQHRELTTNEAVTAMLLPLSCLFTTPPK